MSTAQAEEANSQIRTTPGAGGHTWTGRCLMRREACFELFGVGATSPTRCRC